MGLFSFVKNAGASLFGGKKKKEAEAKAADEAAKIAAQEAENKQMATSLQAVVQSLGFEVEGLNIQVDDDRVVVGGLVKSQEIKEKIILAVGNVEGIAEVDDQMEVEEAAEAAIFYTVQKGDSLSKIAKAHYGNAMKYPVIFEANKPMLSDPDKIYPGQVLRIPPLEA